MVKQAGSSTEIKMIGTISNKINKMTKKDKEKRKKVRLANATDGEIAIMKKYGTYDIVMAGIERQ